MGKRKPVLWLWDCFRHPRRWANPRWFIAAPTRQQVKDIYWGDIKALVPRKWIASVSETELSITTTWGATLCLIGLDKPQRMEGSPWDGGTIDEYSSCKAGLWDANIRPAIADRVGSVDFLGVPDMVGPSQADYEDMCLRGQSGSSPDWADFCWGSKGILPDSEIESMRESMDPRLFLQETTGQFIVAGGRAFPDFSPAHHVKPVAYDPNLPLCWSLDFNINPMCSGVIQHHKGEVRVIKEFELPDTKTDTAVDTFLDAAKKYGWKIVDLTVYGDPTGNARDSTSGTTDWTIIRNRLRNVSNAFFKTNERTKSIKDTVNAVNARLLNSEGLRRMVIDPSCRGLIKDLRAAMAGTDMKENHHSAWIRYFCHQEFPVGTAGATGQIYGAGKGSARAFQ